MRRRRQRAEEAFSLFELMLALSIIAIMAMMIAPTISEVIAAERQRTASVELIRLGHRAQARADTTGKAHLLRFRRGASGNLGVVDVFMGMHARCLRTPWDQTFAAQLINEGGGNDPLGAHEVLDMAEFNPGVASDTDADQQVITLRASQGATTDATEVQLCYQPNGEPFSMVAPETALASQAATVMFTIARAVNGGSRGLAREVIFPAGPQARYR